jgi:predicted enzyme related to lactoylglutathione lyase
VFLPVRDPATAAAWFLHAFDLKEDSINAWAAVLVDTEGNRLTLLGPASGVQAEPGLPWATHNLVVDDLDATHARMLVEGREVTRVNGDPEICRFFSMRDPDGNVLLVCDR